MKTPFEQAIEYIDNWKIDEFFEFIDKQLQEKEANSMLEKLRKTFIWGKDKYDVDFDVRLRLLAAYLLSTDKNEAQKAQSLFVEMDKGNVGISNAKNFLINTTIGNIAGNFHVGDNIGRDKIEKQFNYYGNKKLPKHLHQIPPKPEIFIGRTVELQAIYQSFFEQKDNLLLLINGQGGMGKTTLAIRYYHEYADKYKYMAWVLAQPSIVEAVLQLKDSLQMEFDPTMPNEQRLELLLKELSNLEQPCLLILDNANDMADLESNYQALRSCAGVHLLLTSRVTELGYIKKQPIGGLTSEQALELFARLYKGHQKTEDELVLKIFEAVGQNTLVVEILAKNLQNANPLTKTYPLKDLLADIQGKGILQIKPAPNKTLQVDWHKWELQAATPEAILLAMYDLAELTDEEQALLSVFAVLPAENIEVEVLKKILTKVTLEEQVVEMLRELLIQVERDTELLKMLLLQKTNVPFSEEKLDELIQLAQQSIQPSTALDDRLLALVKKGWIEHNETVFRVSPVVQETVRHKNQTRLWADCEQLIEFLVEELQRDNIHQENYKYATLYSHYAESVVAHLLVVVPQGQDTIVFNCSILCERIGIFHETVGNLRQAKNYYEKTGNLVSNLLAQNPENANYKNALAISYSKLGETHSSWGNLEKALEYFELYNQLKKELYEADSTNLEFKNGLAVSYSKLGETHSSWGKLEKALEYFELLNQLAKELYDADPTNVGFKNALAVSYQFLGNTQSNLGNLKKALEYFELYNQLKKELYEAYPTNLEFKNGLAISYQFLGNTQSSLGNLEKALECFELYNQLEKELYAAYPTNVEFKNGLAVSYSKLGSTHSGLGNLENALEYFELYHQLKKELYEAYPTNVAFKNGLAISYIQLGDLYIIMSKQEKFLFLFSTKKAKAYRQKAKMYYLEGQKHYVELTTNFPAYTDFQHNLRIVEKILASL